jgi:hypothetical protein
MCHVFDSLNGLQDKTGTDVISRNMPANKNPADLRQKWAFSGSCFRLFHRLHSPKGPKTLPNALAKWLVLVGSGFLYLGEYADPARLFSRNTAHYCGFKRSGHSLSGPSPGGDVLAYRAEDF